MGTVVKMLETDWYVDQQELVRFVNTRHTPVQVEQTLLITCCTPVHGATK